MHKQRQVSKLDSTLVSMAVSPFTQDHIVQIERIIALMRRHMMHLWIIPATSILMQAANVVDCPKKSLGAELEKAKRFHARPG